MEKHELIERGIAILERDGWAQDMYHSAFSDSSAHDVELDGVIWRTSEHYFQAQKFIHSPSDYRDVMLALSPGQAAKIGRDRSRPLRADWEDVKDDVMRKVLRAKFTQRDHLRARLLSTGDRDIVERTTYDYYWGSGTKGTGKNMLGVLLVELREELRRGT